MRLGYGRGACVYDFHVSFLFVRFASLSFWAIFYLGLFFVLFHSFLCTPSASSSWSGRIQQLCIFVSISFYGFVFVLFPSLSNIHDS